MKLHTHPLLITALLLLAILLSGCGAAPTTPALTINAPPTIQEPTLTASPSPLPTKPPPSPTPSLTSTPLPTHTPTHPPSPTTPPTQPPTATPTLAPQVIDRSNIARLTVEQEYTLQPRGLADSLFWSPDGQTLLAQVGADVQAFDPATLQRAQVYPGVHAMHFLADGRLLVAQKDLPALLDLASGQVTEIQAPGLEQYNGHTGFDVSLDGQWLAMPVERSGFDLINLSTSEVKHFTFNMHKGYWFVVEGVYFSPDASMVMVQVSRLGRISFAVGIELKGGEKLYEFVASAKPVFSADRTKMTFCGEDVSMHHILTGALWSNISQSYSNQTSDGARVSFSASHIQFWENTSSASYKIGVLYQGSVYNNSWNEILRSPSQLLIYDTKTDSILHSLIELPPFIGAFAFSPDGASFAIATDNGLLSLWQTESGEQINRIEAFDINTAPVVSPDGLKVAYSVHTSARLYSPMGELLQVITPSLTTADLTVRFIGQDQAALFFKHPGGGRVEFWDLSSRQMTYSAPYISHACKFTANGRTMICSERSLRFLDTGTGRWLMDLQIPSNAQAFYAVSPDDRYVAYCSSGAPNIFLYMRETGAYFGQLVTPQGGEVCGNLAFSPDSARLATAAGFVWEVQPRKLLFTLASTDMNAPLMYGSKGDLLLNGSRAYNADDGSLLAELPLSAEELYLTVDGLRLVAVWENAVSIWITR